MALLFTQDSPSIIDLPTTQDRRKFRFDKILKKVVDKYGEDILLDPGIVSVLQELPDEEIHPDTLFVLEAIIRDKAVCSILEHESNEWENDLVEYFSKYSQKKGFDKDYVESIARCIAFSLGMNVEVKPFRSLTKKDKIRTLYSKKEDSAITAPNKYSLELVSEMMEPYKMPSSPVRISSLTNFCHSKGNIIFNCNVEEVTPFQGKEHFFIQVIALNELGDCLYNENKEVFITGPIGTYNIEAIPMEINEKIHLCLNLSKILILISSTLLSLDSERFRMIELRVKAKKRFVQ